jgi:hypothetical protein
MSSSEDSQVLSAVCAPFLSIVDVLLFLAREEEEDSSAVCAPFLSIVDGSGLLFCLAGETMAGSA